MIFKNFAFALDCTNGGLLGLRYNNCLISHPDFLSVSQLPTRCHVERSRDI